MHDSVVMDQKTGNIYVVGANSTSNICDKVFVFNATVSQWFPLPPLSTGISVASVFIIGTTLYVAGGLNCNTDGYLDSIEYLDLMDFKLGWTGGGDLPGAIHFAALCVLDAQCHH